VPRLIAILALVSVLAPFGAIFAVDGQSCCSSMKGRSCPLRQGGHTACRSPLTRCRVHGTENAGQAIVDFQLDTLDRPLTGSSIISLDSPPSCSRIPGPPALVPKSRTFPPELPPPRRAIVLAESSLEL
jgi:hypothetical protein